ncbi:response regulator [Thalassobaculum sp. OXR-137]|uniref:response regulator n=1 Tax=Thalassobaculum sp. OXR-137 TaxID=3100173 RepID=UPI002AC99D05|nr:response regulator [Thalassobaculum sp. OXR-137]WPZ33922.1 response regulator [Thalassobaculum sp. OXR-137]
MEIALPLINNIGLLALAALAYTATPGLNDGINPLARSTILGLALGAASALVMLIPIQFAPGVIFDTRASPVLLSGLLGGPVAALVAAIPPMILRAWIGGIGAPTGVIAMVVYALCSVVGWAIMQRWSIRHSLPLLLAYATIASIVCLPTIFLLPDKTLAWRIFTTVGPILVAANVAGVGIFGLLISVEIRRREIVASLRESETAARDALAVGNRFIAMMSHEVRTPLNAILGYAQLMAHQPRDREQKEQIDRVTAAARTLLRIIDDILHVSRSQGAAETVVLEPTSLPRLIDEAMADFRIESDIKGIDLKIADGGVPSVMVETDGPRLRRCLTNILSNAVAFTEAGHVTLAVSITDGEQGERLRVMIADSGVGMDEQHLKLIFEPFQRLGTPSNPGAGLGLAIVRSSVEALQGSIDIASTPGTGTTVTLDFPTRTLGSVEPAALPADTPLDYAPTTAAKTPRVLVVDDIEINTDIARALLEQIGCSTAAASNGEEAVEAVRSGDFDAVLMDIEMPVLDGLAATRAIRGLETEMSIRAVPIIALTAYVSRDDMSACLDAGMNGYLAKPVDKKALYDALAQVGVLRAAPEDRPPVAPADPAGGGEPAFSQERYEALTRLIPAETLKMVLEQASTEITALGNTIVSPTSSQDDKRQALHKLVSIAGNIGFLRLSARSREYQEAIRSGGRFVEENARTIAADAEEAVLKIATLLSTPPRPT